MRLLWSLVVLLCGSTTCIISRRHPNITKRALKEVRQNVAALSAHGRDQDLLLYLRSVEASYGTLLLDDELPSFLLYKAVALYNAQNMSESEDTLKLATEHYPSDSRAWINLGEIQVQTFKLEEAIASFHRAYQLGDRSALPRSLRTRGWSVSWADFELYSSYIEKSLNRCLRNISECEVDSSGGIEYADVEGAAHAVMASINPNAATALHPIPSEDIAPLWTSSGKGSRRLKVGLMSSDFGVHPVSSLVRGLIQLIDAGRVELYCLSLTSKMSWWGQNITNAVEHFVELTGLNFEDAAMEVASLGIEVLIDLNGHTLHGGLSIMAYHPSPLQMTFLGLPTSTGAAFIDYFLADPVAVPPEHCHHYSERLLLLPHCYIVNDYALLQGDVLKFTDKYRAPRAALNTSSTSSTEDTSSATKLIATLSNSMKMDPEIFAVWTNILRRTPGTRMAIMEYQGHEVYMQHLFAHSAYRGVRQQRLVRTHQTAWIDHLYAKTGLDLILDTRVKNGHTTGLDGVWAGVPTITLAGGSSSEARAGESIARGLGSPFGLTYSLKEYEDLAVSYLQQGSPPGREPPASSLLKRRVQVAGEQGEVDLDPLSVLRRFVEQRRSRAPLFHTQLWATSFTRYLQAAWELLHISRTPNAAAAFNTTPNEGRAPDFQKYNRKHLFHLFSNFMDNDDVAAPRPSDSIIGENGTSSFLARQEYPLEGSLIAAANRAWEASEGLDPLICSEFNRGKTTTTTNDYSPVKLNAPHILGKKSPTSSNTEQQQQPPKGDRARRQQQESCPCRDGLKDGTHDDCSSSCTHLYPPIPDYVFDGRLISLNIGGLSSEFGWLAVNSQTRSFEDFPDFRAGGKVDILRDMHDLTGFPNSSVSAIYSSHTLEHSSMAGIHTTLREWYRVLHIGGLLLLSVPNLETLARMYLDPALTTDDRWHVTRMIYGSQTDAFDFHKVGFDAEILSIFLARAGFCKIERVGSFNMPFRDTSDLVFRGHFVSLNIAAKVCYDDDQFAMDSSKHRRSKNEAVEVNHKADPYRTL